MARVIAVIFTLLTPFESRIALPSLDPADR
jgi:hypothetical protein